MSRAVLAIGIVLYASSAAHAQSQPENDPNNDMAVFVKTRSEEILAPTKPKPKPKCPEPVEGEDIIVCAEVDEVTDQQVFEGAPERSGSSQNANAAACIRGTGCRPPLTGGQSFGKRRPPATPIEEVYRGLPEPDMVVPEGSGGETPIPE
jgi:hypothetical protein